MLVNVQVAHFCSIHACRCVWVDAQLQVPIDKEPIVQ